MTTREAIKIISETPVAYANQDEQGVWDEAIHLAISALERDIWISVEERLPEEPYGCLLIVWDSNPMGGDDFLNYLPYFAGWDGEQWNDGDGMQVPFEVVYWKPLSPLPEPPKEDKP